MPHRFAHRSQYENNYVSVFPGETVEIQRVVQQSAGSARGSNLLATYGKTKSANTAELKGLSLVGLLDTEGKRIGPEAFREPCYKGTAQCPCGGLFGSWLIPFARARLPTLPAYWLTYPLRPCVDRSTRH